MLEQGLVSLLVCMRSWVYIFSLSGTTILCFDAWQQYPPTAGFHWPFDYSYYVFSYTLKAAFYLHVFNSYWFCGATWHCNALASGASTVWSQPVGNSGSQSIKPADQPVSQSAANEAACLLASQSCQQSFGSKSMNYKAKHPARIPASQSVKHCLASLFF